MRSFSLSLINAALVESCLSRLAHIQTGLKKKKLETPELLTLKQYSVYQK